MKGTTPERKTKLWKNQLNFKANHPKLSLQVIRTMLRAKILWLGLHFLPAVMTWQGTKPVFRIPMLLALRRDTEQLVPVELGPHDRTRTDLAGLAVFGLPHRRVVVKRADDPFSLELFFRGPMHERCEKLEVQVLAPMRLTHALANFGRGSTGGDQLLHMPDLLPLQDLTSLPHLLAILLLGGAVVQATEVIRDSLGKSDSGVVAASHPGRNLAKIHFLANAGRQGVREQLEKLWVAKHPVRVAEQVAVLPAVQNGMGAFGASVPLVEGTFELRDVLEDLLRGYGRRVLLETKLQDGTKIHEEDLFLGHMGHDILCALKRLGVCLYIARHAIFLQGVQIKEQSELPESF